MKFNVDLEVICPCGAKVFVDGNECAIVHELPMCAKFRELEMADYLRYLRQALTGMVDN